MARHPYSASCACFVVLLLNYENRSMAETLSGMSCWPVSPLFRLKSALPTLCPQDVFHTMHGGLAKRLLLILVHLLTVAALRELDRLLRHLTLPAGEHRIPSLQHLKKWGFSDAARFAICFCSCFSVSYFRVTACFPVHVLSPLLSACDFTQAFIHSMFFFCNRSAAGSIFLWCLPLSSPSIDVRPRPSACSSAAV